MISLGASKNMQIACRRSPSACIELTAAEPLKLGREPTLEALNNGKRAAKKRGEDSNLMNKMAGNRCEYRLTMA